MTDTKATLNVPGMDEIELPVYSGTIGPDVVDVRSLTGKGLFTYDPGFLATASCESQITYIDGEKGTLLYRGYSIDALATQSTFEEVSYLLIYGDLPTQAELADFDAKAMQKYYKKKMKSLKRQSPQMKMMSKQ